ncbi:Alpha-2,8-sialyltransferase 8F [Holothuria leucospilota]|uniref:Alpha-2,8-sialyltransferase 8F n=1 Tax=Holothuria leucospilota TaxID=206669 RepID=A0A9Q1HCE1_HOLLE|nr:Alpha-2,8-sialyltransferase 8F [Holothuria leucospilota]
MPNKFRRSNGYIFAIIALNTIWVLLFCFRTHLNHCHVFRITKHSVEKKPPVARPMTVNGESNISMVMNRIWAFRENSAEKTFLYKKLLQEKHTFNKTNIDLFRKDIGADLGRNFSKVFIVDQQNSPLGTKLRYNLKSSKKKYFTVTEDFHKRIPKRSKFGNVRRCSVIGNSGIILGSNCGKEIDEADFVFRCNAAPIPPFTADAGKKSNLTSFNPSIFTNRYNHLKKEENFTQFLEDMRVYNGYIWGACFSTSGYIKECLRTLQNYNITENVFVIGHPDHFRNHMIFWEKRGLSKRPSTGFYFTNMAIYHCDEVHLYGFWPFPHMVDSTIKKPPYHYFDDMKFDFEIKNRDVHIMDMEFSILVQLHLLGIIKMHIGECDDGSRT